MSFSHNALIPTTVQWGDGAGTMLAFDATLQLLPPPFLSTLFRGRVNRLHVLSSASIILSLFSRATLAQDTSSLAIPSNWKACIILIL